MGSPLYVHTGYGPLVNGNNGAFISYHDGPPVAGQAGHHPGAIGIDTTNGVVYRNDGTVASSSWVDLSTEVLSVYADATARDAAIASPVAGRTVFNTALGAQQTYTGSFWRTAGRSVIEDLAPDLYMDAALGIGVAPAAAVPAWLSREGLSFAETTNQPVFTAASAFLNGQPCVAFNGTDDVLALAATPLDGSSGTIIIAYAPNDTSFNTLFSVGDKDSATEVFRVQQINNYIRIRTATNTIKMGNNPFENIPLVSTFRSDGSAYYMRCNTLEHTIVADSGANDGAWIGSITTPDQSSIGVESDSSPSEFAAVQVYKIVGWDRFLSTAEVVAVEAELMNEIGAEEK